jgi:hypothetical protein
MPYVVALRRSASTSWLLRTGSAAATPPGGVLRRPGRLRVAARITHAHPWIAWLIATLPARATRVLGGHRGPGPWRVPSRGLKNKAETVLSVRKREMIYSARVDCADRSDADELRKASTERMSKSRDTSSAACYPPTQGSRTEMKAWSATTFPRCSCRQKANHRLAGREGREGAFVVELRPSAPSGRSEHASTRRAFASSTSQGRGSARAAICPGGLASAAVRAIYSATGA